MWKGRAKVQLSWLAGSASLNKCSVGEAQHLSIQRSRKWKTTQRILPQTSV